MLAKIRNFCIIAHIDHGKSTLADRFIEITGTLAKREMKHTQMLDTMDIEQERGITIKLQPVRMEWKEHLLNLIDTPGHVDFAYEVSRSLAACEGAILVVDASQGIEAQTLANVYLAMEHNLKLIPVINKIDLPHAEPEKVAQEIEQVLGLKREEMIFVSGKTGQNVEQVLDAIIERIPAPTLSETKGLQALIFDSMYDTYKGVVTYVRLFGGEVKRGDTIYMAHTKVKTIVTEVGYFRPKYEEAASLQNGEIGYIVTGVKEVGETRVGDTVLSAPEIPALPGYKKVQPMVFAGLYCVEGDDYHLLRDALGKLSLNDSALVYEPEKSQALGLGFRCGFLGLLHMDIVQERLEREYNMNLIITSPSVSYRITSGTETLMIDNPADFPDPATITKLEEPIVNLEVVTPKEYVGDVMKLVQDSRGGMNNMQYLDPTRVHITFAAPLASIVSDFYDDLKSITSGYASMNYTLTGYQEEDLVKMDILVAGERVDAFSSIVVRGEAHKRGSELLERLKDIIPKAQFAIALQAAVGGKIIARETISAFRKDVTGYLYGGDVTRKRKLLEKQKKGKKRMKMVGQVTIPQEAFLAVLRKN
ncbi:MAG: elongation factor 4 [Candidatus Abawacabacteria bacterium]|nr:elongation factor 4 [Candidatus Abawacabacteria bacterium]